MSNLPLLSGPMNPTPAARAHLLDLDPPALDAWLAARELPRYRASQIFDWVYAKSIPDFAAMTNLPKDLRACLAAEFDLWRGRVTTGSASSDGTQKLLITWPDGQAVETVWIPDGERHTVCVSSQVGCPVGCRFCASGLRGVERNLAAGEIVEQALRVRALVTARPAADGRPARLSNVVLMGMGEPLANYEHVVRAIRTLNAPWGLGIGARKITLSTVGLPKQIRRLADEGLQLNLALSLHAPTQELRHELIPWGRVPIPELLDACDYYFQKTGREVTLEYVLLAGVNMRSSHAVQLAAIARRLRCNVNLLRYNPVPGLPYERPTAEAAFAFQEELRRGGVNAHVRTSRGRDIDAACGQLRRRVESAGGAGPDAG